MPPGAPVTSTPQPSSPRSIATECAPRGDASNLAPRLTGGIVEQSEPMRAARLQVLLSAVCFGTTGTAQALGPGGIPPAVVGAARIVVGGALLVLVALIVGHPRAH